jgi:hypothetical protein
MGVRAVEIVSPTNVVRGEVPDALKTGSGYGYGSGDGSGYGYGYGDGYGDGYGSGSGDGYGSGSGSGDGDGYGSGYGDGDGYGYGSGSGDGSKEYWLSCLNYFSKKLTSAQRARLDALKEAGASIAYWRSTSAGLPSNGGGKIEAAAPGVIHTAPGPLNLCNAVTLHATLLPPKWKGERWWIVALIGEVVGDEEKYGCLTREIIGEAL